MSVNRNNFIVPRLATSSLTTAEFRWLHTEAWDDRQKTAFAALRQSDRPLNLYAGVPYESGRRRPAPELTGRWLLEWPAGEPRAVVEAQGFLKAFRTVHVVVTRYDDAGGWNPKTLPALSLMLSGLMLLTHADLFIVIPIEEQAAGAISFAGWGSRKSVWSPVLPQVWDAALLQGALAMPADVVAIDPHEWWLQDHGVADRRTLSYLEKRLDSEARAEKSRMQGRQRSRGFFGRLSRLLRWD